jgi:protein-tyrosine phosphatase
MRVLFVCLGNICRSPTAEGVTRHLAAAEGVANRWELDSAGTADYHIGKAPDPRSQRAARRRGIDLSGLRARQICDADFTRFDLILAMDRANLLELTQRRPPDATAAMQLFMDFAPGAGVSEVPDPYYGADAGFDAVLDLCAAAGRGLLQLPRGH